VSFEVTREPPPPVLSVYLNVTGTHDFGYVVYPDSDTIEALTVKVTSDGNQATGVFL